MIRVSGGTAKGRLLKSPKDQRPTLGRVKQTLFDILAGRIEDSDFLDVFAAGGTVGIEALSRGARHAVFVELKPRNAALIRDNLALCGFTDRAEVDCSEASKSLQYLERRGKTFDIIFLDPPFEDLPALGAALRAIASGRELLSPDGLIVIQRSRRRSLTLLPEPLELFDTRIIGDNALDFLRRKLA